MILTYALIRVPGQTPAVNQLLDAGPAWAAPPLWRSELRNVLLQYVRVSGEERPGGPVTLDDARRKVELAETLIADRTFAVDSDSVLNGAERSGLSAYDAEYVALAQDIDVPLATVDRPLLDAVPDVAVRPEEIAAPDH
jgi:predicted nucleic acid-binding protein